MLLLTRKGRCCLLGNPCSQEWEVLGGNPIQQCLEPVIFDIHRYPESEFCYIKSSVFARYSCLRFDEFYSTRGEGHGDFSWNYSTREFIIAVCNQEHLLEFLLE